MPTVWDQDVTRLQFSLRTFLAAAVLLGGPGILIASALFKTVSSPGAEWIRVTVGILAHLGLLCCAIMMRGHLGVRWGLVVVLSLVAFFGIYLWLNASQSLSMVEEFAGRGSDWTAAYGFPFVFESQRFSFWGPDEDSVEPIEFLSLNANFKTLVANAVIACLWAFLFVCIAAEKDRVIQATRAVSLIVGLGGLLFIVTVWTRFPDSPWYRFSVPGLAALVLIVTGTAGILRRKTGCPTTPQAAEFGGHAESPQTEGTLDLLH